SGRRRSRPRKAPRRPRARRRAAAENLLPPPARSCDRCLLPAARHRDSELLLGGVGPELSSDPTLVDDEDPVGQREDLVELEGDEQDRAALVALLDEPPVDELDRPDVEPSRRLGR